MRLFIKNLITAALSLSAVSLATAQNTTLPIEIGASAGGKFAVSVGKKNHRIGNAVLVRVLGQYNDMRYVTSDSVLMACDGSWISTPVQLSADFDKILSFAEIESLGQSEEAPVPLFAIQFEETSDSKHAYAGLLSRRAAQICKTAGVEPRNRIIPIAGGVIRGGKSSSEAIVSGTSKKSGSLIDVWVRSTDYKTITKVGDEDNFDAARNATGTYTLARAVFNCRSKEYGFYHYVSYSPDAAPKTTTVARETLRLNPVVPDSVAETQLEAVCRLYG